MQHGLLLLTVLIVALSRGDDDDTGLDIDTVGQMNITDFDDDDISNAGVAPGKPDGWLTDDASEKVCISALAHIDIHHRLCLCSLRRRIIRQMSCCSLPS